MGGKTFLQFLFSKRRKPNVTHFHSELSIPATADRLGSDHLAQSPICGVLQSVNSQFGVLGTFFSLAVLQSMVQSRLQFSNADGDTAVSASECHHGGVMIDFLGFFCQFVCFCCLKVRSNFETLTINMGVSSILVSSAQFHLCKCSGHFLKCSSRYEHSLFVFRSKCITQRETQK